MMFVCPQVLRTWGSIILYSLHKIILTPGSGVNMEGRKEILGSEVYEGNENIEKWRDFLNKLENRGMRLTSPTNFWKITPYPLPRLLKGVLCSIFEHSLYAV